VTGGIGHIAQGKPCPYCFIAMDLYGPGLRPTKDHVIPRSKGGRETIWCCYTCNQIKGDMMPDEWDWFRASFPDWHRKGSIAAGARNMVIARRAAGPERVPVKLPAEYEEPLAQSAFEAVYKDRLHMLRKA
jgi:hypothetical protein